MTMDHYLTQNHVMLVEISHVPVMIQILYIIIVIPARVGIVFVDANMEKMLPTALVVANVMNLKMKSVTNVGILNVTEVVCVQIVE